MSTAIRCSQLTESQKQLVLLMTRIGHGRIEDLIILDGEPAIRPAPRIVREYRCGDRATQQNSSMQRDWALKEQVVDLFDRFNEVGSGRVERIEVKNGLPFRLVIEEQPA